MIPPDASLLIGSEMLVGQFSCREKFTTNDRLGNDPQRMFAHDWAYFDLNYRCVYPPLPIDTVRAFANNPSYECVHSQQNVYVFRRKQSSSEKTIGK